MRPRWRPLLASALVLALVAAACSDDTTTAPTSTIAATTTVAPVETAPPTTVADTGYHASITRTAHGVAHIVADDWGSLGFGQGYAFAQDRACTLIDQVIKVRGERAKWFGPGEDDANLDSDFAYRHLGLHDDADARFGDQPDDVRDLVAGYVAGFDAELDEEGPHGWCEGEPWVQPITTTDLYAYLNDVVITASGGALIEPIALATPPTAQPGATTTAEPTTTAIVADPPLATTTTLGSNGWAIGTELSADGGGLLLANPHFPWEGEKRLWESQLTLTTGELDVYGATLSGVPGVLIGFNDAVAWTHTVSAGKRMTLYELTLAPGDPTSYVYGDTVRAMTPTDITIDVARPDGSVEQETRTMWESHYGPMLELPFGWTTEKAYTYRDANIANTDILEQFLGMDAATSMDDFIDVHRTANGIPWVNTIATSADGRAWYADTAATPNLSPEALARWEQRRVEEGSTAALVYAASGQALLDGSDPIDEWVDDPTATRPGILPFEQQPQLERADYVFNANDSHWLANPAQLLTGFSPLTGDEAVPQSARTRMNAILLADPAVRGDDGLLSADEVEAAILSNRSLYAELLLDGVLTACQRTPLVLVDEVPYDIAPACTVLAGWNGEFDTDARGAVLWREYITQFGRADRTAAGPLFRVGFDPNDPVGTPNTLEDGRDVDVLQKLGIAAKALVAAGYALDVALGDVQFDGREGGSHLPLPGGTNSDGAASIVDCCARPSTLGPEGESGTVVAPHDFSDLGYPVTFGDSFMMVVSFTADGPVARAVLTYGQPDDADDPGFTSQTELFSEGTLRPVAFTATEVAADPGATTIEVRGPRD